ncbi:MAG TPA: carboxypeptidase regulatory-like domain-containing protein [Actinotalea sp.]
MINALRLRTPDGRYVRSTNVGQGLVVAQAVATPGSSETFLLVAPGAAPLTSNGPVSLAVCTSSWTLPASLLRVDHNVISLPHGHKGDRLVTYEVGGAGARVLDSPPFSAGYPAYSGHDDAESIFTLVRLDGSTPSAAGTAIATGDTVALQISSNRGNTFFFRATTGASGAEVHGDGMSVAQADTHFVVELNEVRAGVGWRPADGLCRSCAAVTAVVQRAAAGNGAIAGASASVVVQGHTYAGVSQASGRAPLAEPDGNTCVPSGTVTVQASADRYQDGSATGNVPASGATDIVVKLECTLVKGKIIDSGGSGQPGLSVYLRDQAGNLLVDVNGASYHATTAADGSFTFTCVPRGFVQVWTTADPTQLQHTRTIGQDGWVNVVIVLVTTCGDLTGRVVDADTGQGIAGATVTESGGRTTTTDATGSYTFTCLKPAGPKTIFASAPGYTENFATGTAPSTGTSAPVVIPLHKVVVAQIQIRLDWSMQPSDLDSHLAGPDGAGGRFHCFFVNRAPVPYVLLDVDDTSSFGPETVTISQQAGSFVAGDYHYWVHNYSGTSFAGSVATVSVSAADAQGVLSPIAHYDVATASGAQTDLLWHVVDLTIDAAGNVTRVDVQTMAQGNSNTIL